MKKLPVPSFFCFLVFFLCVEAAYVWWCVCVWPARTRVCVRKPQGF